MTVRLAEPVSRHTAWRTGGVCDAWVVAHDVDAVGEVLADCRAAGWKLTVIGAGTRSVFRDGAMPGAVMRLGTGFSTLERVDEPAVGPAIWQVGAAFPVAALVATAAVAGRRGLERLACGPGSVGASVVYDEGWAEVVDGVTIVRRDRAIEVGLDEVRTKAPIVLGARLRLEVDTPAAVAKRTWAAWVAGKPAPCSSWYDLPKRGSLRTLLGTVRLPAVRLRQVTIPDAAPELFVNLGEGTAADLALLHKSVIDWVARARGEELRSRIRWFGSVQEAT